jgi:hypothetical protein
MLSFVLVGLGYQVISFIAGIPADPVQEGKVIAHKNTDLSAKINNTSCLATKNQSNMALNQIDDAVGHAAGVLA